MWHTNQDVQALYASAGSKLIYGIFSGVSGWKQLTASSNDGVTNVSSLLSAAKSFGRKVNVYIEADGTVSRALMV